MPNALILLLCFAIFTPCLSYWKSFEFTISNTSTCQDHACFRKMADYLPFLDSFTVTLNEKDYLPLLSCLGMPHLP
jgi:hypothetical protein